MAGFPRVHIILYCDIGAVRPGGWRGDGDANGRVRERFIGGYELVGARG